MIGEVNEKDDHFTDQGMNDDHVDLETVGEILNAHRNQVNGIADRQDQKIKTTRLPTCKQSLHRRSFDRIVTYEGLDE